MDDDSIAFQPTEILEIVLISTGKSVGLTYKMK